MQKNRKTDEHSKYENDNDNLEEHHTLSAFVGAEEEEDDHDVRCGYEDASEEGKFREEAES